MSAYSAVMYALRGLRLAQRNHRSLRPFLSQQIGETMDHGIKHEFWIVTFATLAAAPVLGGLGFAVVSGLIGI